MLGFKLTNDKSTAVSLDYEWQDLASAPRGVKVQLLTMGKVAIYGQVTDSNITHFLAWAPCPKTPDWLRG